MSMGKTAAYVCAAMLVTGAARAAESNRSNDVTQIEHTFSRLQDAEARGDVRSYQSCLESVEYATIVQNLTRRGLKLTKEFLRSGARRVDLADYALHAFRGSGRRAIVWYMRTTGEGASAVREHFFLCCQRDVDGWKIGPRVHVRRPLGEADVSTLRFADFETLKGLQGWL